MLASQNLIAMLGDTEEYYKCIFTYFQLTRLEDRQG